MSDEPQDNPNRFRVDQLMLDDDGEELARFSVAGATLEIALASNMMLVAPHIANGTNVLVLRIGCWCNVHKCYHSVESRMPDSSLDEEAPLSTLSN